MPLLKSLRPSYPWSFYDQICVVQFTFYRRIKEIYRCDKRSDSLNGVGGSERVKFPLMKTRKGALFDYVRTMKPDEEFAKTLEEIVRRRERAHVRNVQL